MRIDTLTGSTISGGTKFTREGTAEWSATGLEPQGGLTAGRSIRLPSSNLEGEAEMFNMVCGGEDFRTEFRKYEKRRGVSIGVDLKLLEIQFAHQGNFITAAILQPNGVVMLGSTKCSNLDTYDGDIGRRIAFWRALDQYFEVPL